MEHSKHIFVGGMLLMCMPLLCLSMKQDIDLGDLEALLLQEDSQRPTRAPHKTNPPAEEYITQAMEEANKAAGSRTPLCNAIRQKKWQECIRLLEDPHEATAVEFDGTTPLHVAVKQMNPFMIRQLVFAGGDIYAENQLKETPLSLAREYGPCVEQFVLDLSNERKPKKPIRWKKGMALCAGTGCLIWLIYRYVSKRKQQNKPAAV